MAHYTPPRQAFDFFAMPRELRDHIYDEGAMLRVTDYLAETSRRHKESKDRVRQITMITLRTTLLLVSRRFNAEYRTTASPQVPPLRRPRTCVVGGSLC